MSEIETCPTCKRFTETGRQQLALRHRANPISKIDLSRPLEFILADLRRDMVDLRGRLNDARMGFTGWADQVQAVEGLLTCGIIAMHGLVEDAKEHRQKWESASGPSDQPADGAK
ncbi:hypothetical protein ABIF38_006405 [Bradyrhizobium japonicum]|uniref:hypothetical protein n=1 Tax=Bradyrhizobium elkanii TaxID=29448 RepID=UPI0003710641|nr:hypothetical protein [Bradyrhizobium elkanii]WAX24336.1 hypothetical protein [Bradyrhizobium phage ppBeUSDA76-1]MCP1731287.1 hypothetical protein [Bradyrhizobium elkanii]MCS3575416.1 hypothetical protein [Bradyrhizobium elkanii]MCS3591893.1 hypothetical protein [Bradyrhizobium elkanii]MCS3621338.1 hypothetical protein [Bradyrhizobium elkanii]